MLRKQGDAMLAADIYSRFPIPNEVNEANNKAKFDSAFIYGELVSILMNGKQYDDLRLPKYLTLWAKIMGTG